MTILDELKASLTNAIESYVDYHCHTGKSIPAKAHEFLCRLTEDIESLTSAPELKKSINQRLQKEIATGFMSRLLGTTDSAFLKRLLLAQLNQERFSEENLHRAVISELLADKNRLIKENVDLRRALETSEPELVGIVRAYNVKTRTLQKTIEAGDIRITALRETITTLTAENDNLTKQSSVLKKRIADLRSEMAHEVSRRDNKIAIYKTVSQAPGFDKAVRLSKLESTQKTELLSEISPVPATEASYSFFGFRRT